MASLKELRTRISSVKSTQQITKAMKMVAAAKLKRAQDGIIQMRPYAQKLNEILTNLSSNYQGEIESPYLQEREKNKVLCVVITSNRGLCGAFNGNIAKFAWRTIQSDYASINQKGDLHLLCIGKKGYDFFRKRGFTVVGHEYTDIFSSLSFEAVMKAAEYIMEQFASGVYDHVDIFYNEFKNVATQNLRKEQFLPVVQQESKDSSNIDYILEPSPEEIITELIPKTLKIQLYKAVMESNAAEQGARMTAMDKATENAGELLKELRLYYNQTRQAAITTEILEIVGGAEALAQ